MIFPTGPMLTHAIGTFEDGKVIENMLDDLRNRGRRGTSSLPPRQGASASTSQGPARLSLVFEGLIPAPHKTKTKLIVRSGLNYGMPAVLQYTEEMTIRQNLDPLTAERRLDVTSRANVSVKHEIALSIAHSLIGKTLSQIMDQFDPLTGIRDHIITEVATVDDITKLHLDTSAWTTQIIAGQMAEGSTAHLIGHDANFST